MNKVILKGNLGKDPEIKKFEWGSVAKFSLATTESYKNKEGEKVTNTEWHNCVFKGSICDVIEKYVHKGDQLLVEGKNVTRSYEKAGATYYTTEVVCHTFEFCGTKEKVEGPKNNEGEWKSGEKREVKTSDISELGNTTHLGAESDPSFDPFS